MKYTKEEAKLFVNVVLAAFAILIGFGVIGCMITIYFTACSNLPGILKPLFVVFEIFFGGVGVAYVSMFAIIIHDINNDEEIANKFTALLQ